MAESITDLKVGRIVKIGNDPYLIVSSQFLRKQQRKPVMKTKLKNLINGSVIEKNFLSGESFELVEVQTRKCQYLYKDEKAGYFMDEQTYDQFEIPIDTISEQLVFLLEGTDVFVVFYEERPISIQLPFKIDLKVIETPPGVRGDTASGGGKPATLETGLVIQVPFFINVGDIVRVNTETYEYVERVQKE
jgi:elongation factor P